MDATRDKDAKADAAVEEVLGRVVLDADERPSWDVWFRFAHPVTGEPTRIPTINPCDSDDAPPPHKASPNILVRLWRLLFGYRLPKDFEVRLARDPLIAATERQYHGLIRRLPGPDVCALWQQYDDAQARFWGSMRIAMARKIEAMLDAPSAAKTASAPPPAPSPPAPPQPPMRPGVTRHVAGELRPIQDGVTLPGSVGSGGGLHLPFGRAKRDDRVITISANGRARVRHGGVELSDDDEGGKR